MRDDLAGERRDRLPVAEHAALDLLAVDELLDQHLLVVLPRQRDRRLELLGAPHLRDPDGRPEARGLHEHRVVERVVERVALADGDAARDQDPARAEDRLREVAVHVHGARGDARADVGHVRELEQALDGPVLAERAVQDREHDVHVRKRRRPPVASPGTGSVHGLCGSEPPCSAASDSSSRAASRAVAGLVTLSTKSGAELPDAVAADLDRRRLVAGRVEGGQDRAARSDGDRVLARAPAHQHRDAKAAAAHVNSATVIVTVAPCGAFVPPSGFG